jgi:IS5 family transposase
MQPKDMSFDESHGDLFRSSLEQILNKKHPLYTLANKIDWNMFDKSFGALFVQNQARPGLPREL